MAHASGPNGDRVTHILPSHPAPEYARDPYRPDRMRAYLAFAMTGIFALTVATLAAAAIAGNWDRVREFAEVVLPLEAAMLGSALTFYFTDRRPQ